MSETGLDVWFFFTDVWLMAAKYEFEEVNNIENARYLKYSV